MARPLLPHQRKPYSYAVENPHPALFLEMRLGKTLVTIRALLRRGARRVLIAAPVSVLPTWEEECLAEGLQPRWLVSGARDSGRGAGWFLVNPEQLRAQPALLDLPWDAMVLDESVTIKNPKAQITKLLLRKTDHIGSRWVLSGLPAPESYLDVYSQMAFLDGSFMGCGNFWIWRRRWFQLREYDWEPNPGTRDAIKAALHERAMVLTQKQAGINVPKTYMYRVIPANAEQKRLYKRIEDDYELSDTTMTKWSAVAHSWMCQLAGGFSEGKQIGDGKIKELLYLLQGEFAGKQVVVGFRFNIELRAVYQALRGAGIKTTWINGSVAVQERGVRKRSFQAGEYQAMLLQAECGRYGMDLSAADTLIIYSNSWSLNTRRQLEERVVHPQKKTGVLILDLLSSLPVERGLREALLLKGLSARQLMQKIRTFSRRYSV